MGDRANIFAVDREASDDGTVQGIYLYTHWRGEGWPEHLRLALNTPAARRRWHDDCYLLRIVIDQVFADLRDEETGGGVGTVRTCAEYPTIVLDLHGQQVAFAAEGMEQSPSAWYGHLPFAEYIDQVEADYPAAPDDDPKAVYNIERYSDAAVRFDHIIREDALPVDAA